MAPRAPRDPASLGELGAKSAGSSDQTKQQTAGQGEQPAPAHVIDIADAGRHIKLAVADIRLSARQLVAACKKAGAILAAAQSVIDDKDEWIGFCREAGIRQRMARRLLAVHRSQLHESAISRDGLAAALIFLGSPEAQEPADD